MQGYIQRSFTNAKNVSRTKFSNRYIWLSMYYARSTFVILCNQYLEMLDFLLKYIQNRKNYKVE